MGIAHEIYKRELLAIDPTNISCTVAYVVWSLHIFSVLENGWIGFRHNGSGEDGAQELRNCMRIRLVSGIGDDEILDKTCHEFHESSGRRMRKFRYEEHDGDQAVRDLIRARMLNDLCVIDNSV